MHHSLFNLKIPLLRVIHTFFSNTMRKVQSTEKTFFFFLDLAFHKLYMRITMSDEVHGFRMSSSCEGTLCDD